MTAVEAPSLPQLLDRLGWIDGLTLTNVRYEVASWEAFLAALDLAEWAEVFSHDDERLTIRAVVGDTKVRLDMARDLIPREVCEWRPPPPPKRVAHLPESIASRLA